MFNSAFNKTIPSALVAAIVSIGLSLNHSLTAAEILTGLSLGPAITGEGGDGGGNDGWKAKIATNEKAALNNPNARHSLSTSHARR